MRSFTAFLCVLGSIMFAYPAGAQGPPGYYYPAPPAAPYGYPSPPAYYGPPAYQQPAYQQPAYQQPAYQQPMYQQPAYQQAPYGQPTYYYPTSNTSQVPPPGNYQRMPGTTYYYPSPRPAAPAPVPTVIIKESTPAPPILIKEPAPVVAKKYSATAPKTVTAPTKPLESVKPEDNAAMGVLPPPTLAEQGKTCTDGSCGDAEPLACPAGGCQKCKKLKFLVFGDVLYWNVHGAATPFAQPFDGVGPLAAPKGPVAAANPGFVPGFRVGAGVGVGEHCWLMGTVTYFRDSTDANVATQNGDVLHGNVVFPNTVNAAFLPMQADSHLAVRLGTGDLDYKCAFIDNDRLQLSWLAGARYAHLNQDLTTNYAIFGVTTVDTHITFDGGGPRAGLEGEYGFGCGFFGYGKGMLNLLAGHFSANYLQTATFNGQQAQTSTTSDRLVPVLEAELGVGWKSPKGHVRVAAGYYVGGWLNTLTIPTLVQGVQNNNFTTNGDNFRDSLTFDGLFGRLEFRY